LAWRSARARPRLGAHRRDPRARGALRMCIGGGQGIAAIFERI